jgi:hypothetical protein
MNGFADLIKKNWWKVLLGVFSAGVFWQTVQGRLADNAERLEKVEKSALECHDFMIAQGEINKKINGMDDKLDRVLARVLR